MRFLNHNLCTDPLTVITASSSNPSFPVSNLKHPFRSKRFRTTGVSSEWIKFDFLTIQDIDSVIMLWPKEDGIRISEGAISIQANATDEWSSPAVDIQLTVDNDYMVGSHFFSTPQQFRFWRIRFLDPGNPFGFIEVGNVWIGESLEFNEPENGFVMMIQDQSQSSTTDFGHTYVDEYPQLVKLEFTYNLIEYDTAKILENAFRENGNRKPVLVAFDDQELVFDKDHFLVYGMMSNELPLTHLNYNLFGGGVSIRELG